MRQKFIAIQIFKFVLSFFFLVFVSLEIFAQATLPINRTDWDVTPTGWTDNAGGTYLSTFACSNSNGGKFATTGDNYQVFFNSNPDVLTYTIKLTSNGANAVLVEESVDGAVWTTVANDNALTTTCDPYTHNLNSASRYVRWTYTKVSNATIDDVIITAGISCSTPTVQASNITFPSIGLNTMTISWTNGNGTGRIVKMNTVNTFTDPVDLNSYTANSLYAGGEQVVYNGTGSTVNVTGLTPNTQYFVKIYEYDCTGASSLYLVPSTATSNSTTLDYCTNATVQASNIVFSGIGATSTTVSWTNGNGNYRIVVAKQGSTVTGTPTNGTTYTASSAFGAGSTIAANEFVVYKGVGNSFTVTGLTVATTYYFKVFEFCAPTGNTSENYLTTNPPSNSATTINNIPTKCLEIESILVDGCDGSNEGKNEMVRFRVGPNPIDVNNLRVDGASSNGIIQIGKWPTTTNSWLGICTDAQATSNLAILSSNISACGELLEPTSGILPAGASVILFTSTDYTPAPQYFANLGETVYVIFQCAGNTAGHFGNYSTPSSTRTLVLNDISIGCADTVIYDPSQLLKQDGITLGAEDGGAVRYGWDGTATYYNNGCSADISTGNVYALNASGVNHICVGDNLSLTGTADQNITNIYWTGGTGTFSSPNTLTTTYTPGELDSGLLTLYLYGESGACGTVNDTVMVNIHELPTPTISNDTTICNLGTAALIAGGGNSYLWSNNSTSDNINVSPSSQTTYNVTVTSIYGCKHDTSVTVNVNPNPTVDLGANQDICTDSTLTLDAGAGFTYLWTGGTTSQTIDITASGTYSVTITDSNGCKANDNVIISDYNYATLNPSSTQTDCGGNTGTVSVAPVGGSGSYTYLWDSNAGNQTSSSVSGLGVGTYYVTVDDGNCKSKTSASVSEAGAPTITLNAPDTVLCIGDSASLSVSGNADSYLWNTTETSQSITYTPLTDTIITVTGILNGCSSIKSVNLIVNSLPIVDLGTDVEECSGTTITLDAGSFTSYSWSNSSSNQSINPTTSGTYTVTVTDINGCKNSDFVQVIVNPNPIINLGNDTTYCGSNSLTLNAGSGFSYLWNDNSINPTFTVTSTGSYSVTITDSNGCKANDNISVTINANPVANASMTQQATCGVADGAASVTASGGTGNYSYQWSSNAGSSTNATVSSLSGGEIYYVTVNDGNCEAVASVNITETGAPTLILTAPDTVMCFGENLSFSISGADSYSWSNGDTSPTISYSPASSTTLTVTGSTGGCNSVKTVDIIVNQLPALNMSSTDANCLNVNGSASVNVNGTLSYSYEWSNGSTDVSISNLSAGTYSVTVTDSNTCRSIESVTISTAGAPTLEITPANATICEGDSLVLSVTGANSYLWSTSQTDSVITVTPTNSYTYTVTETSSGCNSQQTVDINVDKMPVITISPDASICGNDSIPISASTNAGSLLWSTGASSNSIYVHPGIYTVSVSNGSCSTQTSSIEITQLSTPNVNWSTDTIIYGESGILDAGNEGSFYYWSTGETTQTITITKDGTYSVTVTSTSDCEERATIVVVFKLDVTIHIYNTITPNGDNINDKWIIENIEYYPKSEVMIFNRSGNKVYETTRYNNEKNYWDGKYNGKDLPAASYYYIIDLGEGSKIYKGHVSIVK